MPPARDDKRLLIVVGVFVALAGALFAGVILLATNRDVGEKQLLFLGQRRDLVQSISEASPLYFASPFADQDGFWLDLEGGELVALVLDTPAPGRCAVKWKEQRGDYIDCDDRPVAATDLDRYALRIESRDGSPATSVYVDLRKRVPAPDTAGGPTG